MRNYIRYVVYLIVSIGFSAVFAGSYDDFFVAIKRDSSAAVSALLDRGFDPNTLNPQGEYGLILALREPSLHVAEVLIANPATQVEVRTAEDESPLMLAAIRGYTAICQQLIERDADVNKPGWTPLHYAATGGHEDIIQLLLDNHAYVDAASPNGSTPLMMAAMYGTSAAVQLLLEAGADPSLKNDLGLTAIDFASKVKKTDSVAIIAEFIRAQRPKGSW
ncbi:MAG: ankyrin repeat domain-containing protein [Rhodoferax sp.]